MSLTQAALAFVTLFVVVHPVAIAPVFAALTRGMDAARVRRTALVSTLAGFGAMAVAGLAGHSLLALLGRERTLVHAAIALVLVVAGVAMLAGRDPTFASAPRPRRDPALVPIAVPLVAGPGAFGTMAMLASKNQGHLGGLYLILAVVGAMTYGAFRLADPIARLLGPRGLALIVRGLGVFLVLGGVWYGWEALRDYGLIGGARP